MDTNLGSSMLTALNGTVIFDLLMILETKHGSSFEPKQEKLDSKMAVSHLIKSITKIVLRSEVSWIKLLGVVVTCGFIAIQLLEQTEYALIHQIPVLFCEAISGPGAQWLIEQGGWMAIEKQFTCVTDESGNRTIYRVTETLAKADSTGTNDSSQVHQLISNDENN